MLRVPTSFNRWDVFKATLFGIFVIEFHSHLLNFNQRVKAVSLRLLFTLVVMILDDVALSTGPARKMQFPEGGDRRGLRSPSSAMCGMVCRSFQPLVSC